MRAKTGSFETEYLTAGSGPWLILLHWLGGSLEGWQPQIEAFAHHFKVLAYDLRGQGRSGNPGTPYSVADAAGDLLRLMDELGIERASLAGLSMGGMVAQGLALAHPDRLDKLVLADTTFYYQGEAVDTWRQRAVQAQAEGLEPLAEPSLQRWFTPEFRAAATDEVARIRAIFTATDPAGYALACGALAGFDLRGQLGRIGLPALVLAGEHDPSCPPALAEQLAAAVQHGRFELVRAAAHLANIEQPQRFNQLVLDFLTG